MSHISIHDNLVNRLADLKMLKERYNNDMRDYHANIIALQTFRNQLDDLRDDLVLALDSIVNYVHRQYHSLLFQYGEIESTCVALSDIYKSCKEIMSAFDTIEGHANDLLGLDVYLPVPNPVIFKI